MREFKRILPSALSEALADGWIVVASEEFAGGFETSWLLMRELAGGDDAEARPAGWLSVHGLGPDELRVVMRVIERLRIGRAQYGPLDVERNPKDWRAEATEEFLDGAIYMAMESLRREGR